MKYKKIKILKQKSIVFLISKNIDWLYFCKSYIEKFSQELQLILLNIRSANTVRPTLCIAHSLIGLTYFSGIPLSLAKKIKCSLAVNSGKIASVCGQ
ncbi:hypothetical protein BpHYR1_016363 [Brachionus plicatilis]|uniref:Uncharacterized protein n=1 Tax=Brachionus plicatilis TaxID=10195 RepID=A0A3M7RF19_BRAPC|nr:hypothetical protein BpHYR1_016363 [Brachionus plicatilis]